MKKTEPNRHSRRAGRGRDSHVPRPLNIDSSSKEFTARSPSRGEPLALGKMTAAKSYVLPACLSAAILGAAYLYFDRAAAQRRPLLPTVREVVVYYKAAGELAECEPGSRYIRVTQKTSIDELVRLVEARSGHWTTLAAAMSGAPRDTAASRRIYAVTFICTSGAVHEASFGTDYVLLDDFGRKLPASIVRQIEAQVFASK